MRYEVKCDECKTTMRHTDSLHESACGGTCGTCRAATGSATNREETMQVKGWEGQQRAYKLVGTVESPFGTAYELEGARGAAYGMFPCSDSRTHFNVINLGRMSCAARIFGARQFRLEDDAFVAHV